MKKIRLAVIGAGSRGTRAYASYALENPHEAEFVAVAEPDKARREYFARIHNIDSEYCFDSWAMLLNRPKFCDALVIATQDDMHFGPAMKALELGYDILLEKPMSNSLDECREIAEKAKQTGRIVMICYVLRYTAFFQAIKSCLDEGLIGDIISIQHNENVGFFHQAHSFVRGNWRNSKETSPMILAKSCHDMDVLNWLIGKKCLRLSSFGSLKYFRPENAPKNSAERCLDGCGAKDDCPYYVMRYWENRSAHIGFTGIVAGTDKPDCDTFFNAAKTGPYGRCVFRCDNDVVDHQVVNMEYEDGITVAFTMCAFTDKMTRTIKIMGTKGELNGHMEGSEIRVLDFLTGSTRVINVNNAASGHSGGDFGIMRDFLKVCGDNSLYARYMSVNPVLSHEMAFAAEEARLTKKVIELGEN